MASESGPSGCPISREPPLRGPERARPVFPFDPPPPRASMSDFLQFFGKFLRHGTTIASLAPSSRWLSRATVRNVDWDRARVLIELGAGTGPITRVLAEKARPDCRVIVLERDQDFAT